MNVRGAVKQKMSTLSFIHDILKKGGPMAVFGGLVVLAVGLILGRLEMILAGALVTFLGSADYIVVLLRKNRNWN